MTAAARLAVKLEAERGDLPNGQLGAEQWLGRQKALSPGGGPGSGEQGVGTGSPQSSGILHAQPLLPSLLR